MPSFRPGVRPHKCNALLITRRAMAAPDWRARPSLPAARQYRQGRSGQLNHPPSQSCADGDIEKPMKIVKSAFALLVAAGFYMASSKTHAHVLIKEEADIKLIDGIPAICIPSRSWGAYQVSSLLVMEPYTHRNYTHRKDRWLITLKDDARPMKLRPGKCISYGSIPRGYQLGPHKKDAHYFSFETNKSYRFSLYRAGRFMAIFQTGIYETTFCLKEDADGTVSIQKESACPDSSR